MLLRSLRLYAAIFAFFSATIAGVPASAATFPPAESTLADAMRSFNPQLPLAKARTYARSVMADAWRTHLDPKFIMSIVTVESRWRANAISRVGARGLGQLMPGTAARLGVNPRNPAENLRGTSAYLRSLLNRFAGKPNQLELAIAGYNAGPKAVERYHGVPPYAETQHYVVRVLRVLNVLNARLGPAFAPAPIAKAAMRSVLPDERTWNADLAPAAAPWSPADDAAAAAAAAAADAQAASTGTNP